MVSSTAFRPAEALRPYIRSYQLFQYHEGSGGGSAQLVTPDGCYELDLVLADPMERTEANGSTNMLDPCYVVGRMAGPYRVRRTGAAQVVSVRFRAWGLAAFTPMPPEFFCTGALPAIEVFGKRVFQWRDEVAAALARGTLVRTLDRIFLEALRQGPALDGLVADAAGRILQAGGHLEAGELYRPYACSPRRLQQRFMRQTGTTPKAFATLARFQGALTQLMNGASLQDVAYHGRYYDQAHFTNMFKRYAGISPKRYTTQAHPLNEAMMRD